MNAWPMIRRLIDSGELDGDRARAIERVVQSAVLARISEPREAVAETLLDRLDLGASFEDALERVEDLVAIRHNRMLIDAGRRGGEAEDVLVLRWAVRRPHPVYAA